MANRIMTIELLDRFAQYLREEERSDATLEKYLREVRQFFLWLSGAQVSKTAVSQWKEYLLSHQYHPSTINGKLTALDRFRSYCGWQDCRVKHLKLQRQLFREDHRELNRYEYGRLIAAAVRQGNERLALLIETICATGIRVSEVKYITLDAVHQSKAEVFLKGKIRTILIPGKLCRKLKKYAQKNKITSGELFLTRSGRTLSRKQIWSEMKALCEKAGVEASKVFPHNLRHLFARTFYNVCQDVVKLADVLGHSATETTRIYLVSTGAEHTRMLEQLNLVQ